MEGLIAIFFISAGDSPFFRQMGGIQSPLANDDTRGAGAGALVGRNWRRSNADGSGRCGPPARHPIPELEIGHMKNLSLLTAVGIAALTAIPSVAIAQQKTLYVAGYGGSFEKIGRAHV